MTDIQRRPTGELTADVARQVVRYEPETGKLFWLRRPREFFDSDRDYKRWNTRYADKETFTSRDGEGYHIGCIFNRIYKAHRVAWLVQTGTWPAGHLDHLNGDPSDNRIANLLDVLPAQNQRNRRLNRNNTSGAAGIYRRGNTGRWGARVYVNGCAKHLGFFDTFEEAVTARLAANKEHGFTARHGT
jgi:hypothetical protein